MTPLVRELLHAEASSFLSDLRDTNADSKTRVIRAFFYYISTPPSILMACPVM